MSHLGRLTWILVVVLVQPMLPVECAGRRGYQRESRTLVTLNPTVNLGFGIQVTVPLSFFMPTLGFFGRHSRAGRHYTSAARRRPSIHSTALLDTCSNDGVPVEDYFYLLHIDVESCQQRFICEMASDPVKFQPLSSILLKKVARVQTMDRRWQWSRYSNTSVTSTQIGRRNYDLNLAARRGVESSGAVCSTQYGGCPVPAESMVNMNLLFLWRVIESTMNITFNGEV